MPGAQNAGRERYLVWEHPRWLAAEMSGGGQLVARSLAAVAVIETKRLRLREWTLDDLDALAEVFAEPAVWRFPYGRGFSQDETRSFIERQVERRRDHGFEMWAAEQKVDGGLIGFIGLAVPNWLTQVMPAVEVGWRLHPRSWGRGLATEGGAGCLRYGFETLGLDRIIAIFDADNLASGRVMDRLGMTP